MRPRQRFSLPVLVAAVAALVPLVVFAADADHRVARLVTTARAMEWRPAADSAAIVLSLQRPDGEVITQTFAAGSNPMLSLDGLADGLYSYELRSGQPDAAPLVQSGSFSIEKGAVVSPNAVERVQTTAKPPLRIAPTRSSATMSRPEAASAPAPIAPLPRRMARPRPS